ncbi:J domain-containing protein DDB_G0295729-like [Aphis gossypii]|uniref:J domain-containing protein n=1 Tax=Aphis gossypii TaxID=80765 RepID=A0A9P0NAL9_APHGO|nr:J domain-containing protein DDB_G0295729-like [Aphis gossypii]CAH1708296.1 unnamed protein product [Aphis gossypii]
MESNRDEASRCIDIARLYFKKKDLDNAWKFSVKANKMYPSSETKRLISELKSSMKNSNQRSMNQNQSDHSDSSYNGDDSNSSSSTDYKTKKQTKRSRRSRRPSTVYSHKMFKEINKDESFKCLERAEQFLKTKQFDLAEKFVLKSKKLFPIPRADELLQEIQEIKGSIHPEYTEEQANIVEKVKNSENHYTMLNIKRTATVPEIKKAYKKLALLLHPDKNSAPGSGEVFKDVSNAVDTLCDNTKRQIYDQTLIKPKPSTSRTTNYPQSSCRYQSPYYHTRKRNTYTSYTFCRSPSLKSSDLDDDDCDVYDDYDDYINAHNEFNEFNGFDYYEM